MPLCSCPFKVTMSDKHTSLLAHYVTKLITTFEYMFTAPDPLEISTHGKESILWFCYKKTLVSSINESLLLKINL